MIQIVICMSLNGYRLKINNDRNPFQSMGCVLSEVHDLHDLTEFANMTKYMYQNNLQRMYVGHVQGAFLQQNRG